MVRIHPDPPDTAKPGARRRGARPTPDQDSRGAIAQLGERLLCKQEVTGSIPVGSTTPGGGRSKNQDPRSIANEESAISCACQARVIGASSQKHQSAAL